MRIGIGYDVHKIIEGNGITLGGVYIKCNFSLKAHSDGDVLIHAIMDSLLGAASLGDIGVLFPDNDDRYKDISSLKLLKKVGNLLRENNYEINNIDSVVMAEAPKLSTHYKEMISLMAKALAIDETKISVKATTEEGLGFTGKQEGIKAEAICLINKINK